VCVGSTLLASVGCLCLTHSARPAFVGGRHMGLLGDQRWVKDEVPFFTLEGRVVPPGLAKVVRPLVLHFCHGDVLSAAKRERIACLCACVCASAAAWCGITGRPLWLPSLLGAWALMPSVCLRSHDAQLISLMSSSASHCTHQWWPSVDEMPGDGWGKSRRDGIRPARKAGEQHQAAAAGPPPALPHPPCRCRLPIPARAARERSAASARASVRICMFSFADHGGNLADTRIYAHTAV